PPEGEKKSISVELHMLNTLSTVLIPSSSIQPSSTHKLTHKEEMKHSGFSLQPVEVICVTKDIVEEKNAVLVKLKSSTKCGDTQAKIIKVLPELCGEECKLEIYQEDDTDHVLVSGKYVKSRPIQHKLRSKSFQVDEENQANTLVSVAPLPQEPADKPTANGESPPENGTNPTPTTNGHSATQNPVADTEM
uniref:Si:ch211-286o17.1 n=1 Tax=Poecilia latipinna TaxID=48699 RepID=A0A3B3UY61_9TELE